MCIWTTITDETEQNDFLLIPLSQHSHLACTIVMSIAIQSHTCYHSTRHPHLFQSPTSIKPANLCIKAAQPKCVDKRTMKQACVKLDFKLEAEA